MRCDYLSFCLWLLEFVANDVFAGVFQGNLGTGLEGGEGNFLIPVEALFPGAVFVRLSKEDEPQAMHAVHEGRLGFLMVINQGVGMRTAGKSGNNQLLIPMQRQAEKIDHEDGNDTAKGKKDDAHPFHPDNQGIYEQSQKHSQDDEKNGIALFQLRGDLLKVFFGIKVSHMNFLRKGLINSEFRIQNSELYMVLTNIKHT